MTVSLGTSKRIGFAILKKLAGVHSVVIFLIKKFYSTVGKQKHLSFHYSPIILIATVKTNK